jgi:hypothetical protein
MLVAALAASTAMLVSALAMASPAHADEAWSELGSGANYHLYALAADASGNVYAGGGFTTAGGSPANYVAKWNGSTWTALPGISGDVHSLAIDAGGNVYAGGAFGVAKWNGSAWSSIGSLGSGFVLSLATDASGNVYAGGWFTTINGDPFNNVAKWNGSSWSALGLGTDYDVFALTTDSSGNVYAGGAFVTAGGIVVDRVAKWNGSSWSALGTGMSIGMPDRVYALATDASGNVYAGGFFTTAGGTPASRVAKWDGSSWSALGAGLDQGVMALATDAGGNVYAGGFFTTAGGPPANRVAKWDGSAWSALGAGMNQDVLALAIDAGGNVYAGGYFTTAGGVSANYIAKWAASVPAPAPVPPPTSPPGAPASVTAIAGHASAAVSWTAPADPGSYPVSTYQVTATPGGHACLTSTLTCDIGGLTNGTAYTFTARALNGAGWGAWSGPTNAVTPSSPAVKTIQITGSRDASDTRVVRVSGTTTSLVGEQVAPWVRFTGQTTFTQRPGVRTVAADGTFAWSRVTGKKVHVYFTHGSIKSNTVVIASR